MDRPAVCRAGAFIESRLDVVGRAPDTKARVEMCKTLEGIEEALMSIVDVLD